MSILQTIEANAPPTVIISSVSLAGLEGVLGSSPIRFYNDRPDRFGNSSPSNEEPIVKPARKRSMYTLNQLNGHGDKDCMQNAIFNDDHRSQLNEAQSARIVRLVSCSETSSRSSSFSYRSPRPSSPDHLMERYLKLVENCKLKSKIKAPQKPQRKASMVRKVSSVLPLAMPVRKASKHSIANFTSSSSRRCSL
ncbi:MAG: hypothetical protein SGBAC_012603 [Bacillariaceae sp.]